MNHCLIRLCFFLAFAVTVRAAFAITISTVTIGNPGNPADTRFIDSDHPNGAGSVGQSFNIGKNEISNAQYVAFLNAVAASDPYGLYSASMASTTWGGILRSGSPGTYLYAIKAAALSGSYTYDDKPVVYLNSGDAMRFTNWLHNGQPSGAEDATTTEDGAYTLNGAVTDAALSAITRNAGARWWLPSENEWYKAAYYNPILGTYYNWPTGTNSVPNNNLPSSDTGNSANFNDFGFTTGNINYPLTNVGAYTLSDSPYGTFDQGGNVAEWLETVYSGSLRGVRGGSWDTSSSYLHAGTLFKGPPTAELEFRGFRVASAEVPEPGSFILLMAGIVAIVCHIRMHGSTR